MYLLTFACKSSSERHQIQKCYHQRSYCNCLCPSWILPSPRHGRPPERRRVVKKKFFKDLWTYNVIGPDILSQTMHWSILWQTPITNAGSDFAMTFGVRTASIFLSVFRNTFRHLLKSSRRSQGRSRRCMSKTTSSCVNYSGPSTTFHILEAHMVKWLRLVGRSPMKQLEARKRWMTVTAMILWTTISTITTGPSSTELVRILTDQIHIHINAPESAESLYRAYTNVLNTLKAREEIFKKFNASVRPDLVKKWEEVDDTPRRDPITKKVISVHEAKFKTSQYFVILLLIIVLIPLFSPSHAKKGLPSSSHAGG